MAEEGSTDSGSGVRLNGGAIVTIIGVVILVIFIVQNSEKIRLHFLAWYFDWSLWLFTLVSAAFGALVLFGVGALRRYRSGRAKEGKASGRADS
jgi:uncharacterized integral membrane protein